MTRQSPYQDGLDKSLDIRERCGFDFKTPLSIFDVCDQRVWLFASPTT